MNHFISQEELSEALGYERPADLRKCLDAYNVPYFIGKGGRIAVLKDAINDHNKPHKEEVEFE